MNERIKELAEQATFLNKDEESIEYFAELIVRECADIIDGRDENGNAKDGQYLLTQFGIDVGQRYT